MKKLKTKLLILNTILGITVTLGLFYSAIYASQSLGVPSGLTIINSNLGIPENEGSSEDRKTSNLLYDDDADADHVEVHCRGISSLVEGQETITLPAYFEALSRTANRIVLLSPIDGMNHLAIASSQNSLIKDGQFKVYSDNPKSAQAFAWSVYAMRKEFEPLILGH